MINFATRGRRRWVHALLSVVMGVVLPVATWSGPVSAEPLPEQSNMAKDGPFTNYGKLDGAGMHVGPEANFGWTVTGMIPPGQAVKDFCYDFSERIGDYRAWDVVYNETLNRAGWTNEGYLTDRSQVLSCSDARMRDFYPYVGALNGMSGVGIHTCTNNTCKVVDWLNHGYALCYSFGASLGTNSTRWVLIISDFMGIVGWVHQNWLSATTTVQC